MNIEELSIGRISKDIVLIAQLPKLLRLKLGVLPINMGFNNFLQAIAKQNQLKEFHGSTMSYFDYDPFRILADTESALTSFDSLQILTGQVYSFLAKYFKNLMAHFVRYKEHQDTFLYKDYRTINEDMLKENKVYNLMTSAAVGARLTISYLPSYEDTTVIKNVKYFFGNNWHFDKSVIKNTLIFVLQ